MSTVSQTIVREYFELHGFLVRQARKYIAPNLPEEAEIDFFVLNPRPGPGDGTWPFVLQSEDLPRLERAIVAVKGWHTEAFTPSVLQARGPEFLRFAGPALARPAARFFGRADRVAKVLVLPALAQTPELREKSIELLRARGVDAVIPFRTMLADLVAHVEPKHNYQHSDLLQTIRILKNYEFIREPQLELFTARRKRTAPGASREATASD